MCATEREWHPIQPAIFSSVLWLRCILLPQLTRFTDTTIIPGSVLSFLVLFLRPTKSTVNVMLCFGQFFIVLCVLDCSFDNSALIVFCDSCAEFCFLIFLVNMCHLPSVSYLLLCDFSGQLAMPTSPVLHILHSVLYTQFFFSPQQCVVGLMPQLVSSMYVSCSL